MDEMKRTLPPKMEFGELEKLQQEAIASLKADKRTYSLIHDDFHLTAGEAKAAMAPLLDYLEDLHICDACPGVEVCPKENVHYQMELRKEDGLITPFYHLCEKQKEVETYQNAFLLHDFPAEWNGCSLKKDVDRSAVKKPALLVAQKILIGQSRRWLYLKGSRRSGRSFFLACLANDFARKGKGKIAFADASALLESLRGLSFSHQKEAFEAKLKELSSCALLVLDDFGNEAKDKTGFAFSSILFPLLNERAKAGLPTGFSSDFSIAEIAEMYEPSIGKPRARQLKTLLLDLSQKEFDITSLPLH